MKERYWKRKKEERKIFYRFYAEFRSHGPSVSRTFGLPDLRSSGPSLIFGHADLRSTGPTPPEYYLNFRPNIRAKRFEFRPQAMAKIFGQLTSATPPPPKTPIFTPPPPRIFGLLYIERSLSDFQHRFEKGDFFFFFLCGGGGGESIIPNTRQEPY